MKKEFVFDGTAVIVIDEALEIAHNNGLSFVPKEYLWIAIFSGNADIFPVYNYVLSKGVSEEEFRTRGEKVFNEIILEDGEIKQYKLIEFTFGKEFITIDVEIMRLFNKAKIIQEEYYDDTEIGCKHFIEAFSNLYPEKFDKIMTAMLGGKKMDNFKTITIPENLSGFLTDLTEKFEYDDECYICGRENETRNLIKILMKNTKRNAVLVGEPGVGKTALVEKFAWMIATGNCPKKFKDCKIISLDVNGIVAGTKYRGMAEERFQQLINFLERNPNVILFVDEIHLLLGAGACVEGEVDLANALKPILARGDTRVIGATTVTEYKKYFSKDGALKRRFEEIYVKEPKTTEVYEMIKNQIKLLESAHRTKISKKLVEFAIFEASCFNFQTKNPDRTLDLLDKSMVCAELEGRGNVKKKDILENFDLNMNKFKKMSEKSKKATAYHEAGHYIAYKFSKEIKDYTIKAISIIPTGETLGVNVLEYDDDITTSCTRNYFIEEMAIDLAGRVAEKMFTNELSAGAQSDLKKATMYAKGIVMKYGLIEGFHNRVFLEKKENEIYTKEMAEKINSQIDSILDEALKKAEELLANKEEYVKVLVELLLKKGMVSNKEIDALFKKLEN